MGVSITVEGGPYRGVAAREIVRRARAMMRLLQLDEEELSIVITGDSQIHKLNRDYRGKDRPTDVLAFSMREGAHGEVAGALLGDVIISVDTARRQAAERGVLPLAEVTMLLAHGLLHLLGWDHRTAAEDRRMRAETARLCAAAAPARPRAPSTKRGASRPLTKNPGASIPAQGRKKVAAVEAPEAARGGSPRGGMSFHVRAKRKK